MQYFLITVIINFIIMFSSFSLWCNHEIHEDFVKDFGKERNLQSILEGINIENVNFGIGFI